MNAENSDPRQFDGSGLLGSTAGFANAEQTNGIAKAARVFGSVLSNDDNANDIDNVEPNTNELLDCGIHKKKSPAMLLSSEENAANPSSSHRTSTKGGPDKVSTGSMTSVATAPNEDSNGTNTSAVSESDSLSYSPSPLIERLQLSDKTTTPRDLSFDSAKCGGKFDNTCGDEEGEDDDEVASTSGEGSHSSSSSGTGGSKSYRYTSSSGTNGRRNLVAKTQRSITRGRGSGGSSSSSSSNGSLLGSGSGASVNQSINAARSAKQSHLLTRQSKMAQIRSERQNQKLDAATFHAEAERMRREALAMQRQLSAKFAKARAQREAAIKADRLNAITREVEFKASVYREHQATNKELEDRRRRQSSQVKSTIWAERRMNTERMRLDRIEEDRAWMEERNLGSRAARKYAHGEAEKRRQSLAFRNAEGRRIREEAEQRRAEELHDESQSIQLKLAGQRDADDYRRQMAEERRMSHEFRHQEAFRQREEAEQRRAEEIAAKSASIQLKLAGQRDADDYRRQMAEERRMSHEFRHQEAFRQREEAEQRRAEEIATESASIQLKLAGERDADDYRRQMAEERRMSHEFRHQEAFRQREEAEQRRAEEIATESASIQLKLAGQRDADDYRRQMAEERRMSHEFRHQEAFRQREEAEQRRAEKIATESASIQLKLAGERDADDYRRQMAEERRMSHEFRHQEAFRQREEAEQRRAEELHDESQSIQLKLAGERDADDYRRQMAEERRMSHEFRHQEAFRQREEAEQRRAEEIAAESASIQLKLAGERDADDYCRQMAEERRQSLAFRNAEGRRIREEEDQRRAEEIAAESASIQLKLAGERDADDYRRQMDEERRKSFAFRNEEGRRQREEDEQKRIDEVIAESESIQLKLAGEREADDYRRQMAARKRASLQYRNKEGRIHRMVEANQRADELNQRHVDSKLRSVDAASIELARQKEKAQRALFELEHQGRLKPF